MRVTIGGKRLEVSANNAVQPSRWMRGAGKVKGNSEETRTINAHLDMLKRMAQDYRQEILMEGSPLTIDSFKAKWFGLGEVQHTLMHVIREHNSNLEKLIGKGYERTTCVKYRTTEKHVEEFIRWKYKIADLNLRALKFEFIVDLEFYLKSQKNLSVNSYGKIIKNLKKIIHECVAKDWLPKDPFSLYKVKHIDPQVPHLSADELQKIEVKEFTIERLALVRDLFLFSCYTGLAYIDAANLTLDNIVTGFDGRQWVVKNREKTNVMSRIPLLQPAQKILEKYKDHPKTGNTGKLLPMMSNQKVNSYLRMSLIDWTAKFDDLPRSPAAIAVLEDLQTLYKYPFGREIWAKLWFKYVARRNWVKGSLILTLRGKKRKAVRSFRMKEKTRSRSRKPVNVSWESNGRCRNSCYTVKLKKWKHR